MPSSLKLARSLSGCRSWESVQRSWSGLSKKQKGDLFEELVKHYLLLEPEYSSKIAKVWLLKEVPTLLAERLKLPPEDKGIDLVAETKEGEYWAIQCKYKQESDQSVTWREISTFTGLAFGVCRGFSFGLIASTTERITKVLKDQDRIGFAALDVWQGLDGEFFSRLQARLKHKRQPLEKRLPRPHQKEALKDAIAYFAKNSNTRGKLIMPCGTGKSLTSYFIAQKLKARKVLIAVPSLALIKQTLKEWMRESMARGQDVEWICVCSDESAGRVEQDDIAVLTQDLGVPCYTDSRKIADWLKREHGSLTIVFTTYQSGDVLSKAAKRADFSFDLGIMDEAHKTTGAKDRLFSHLLHEKNIRIKKRLFMTATERRYRGESDEILSMDDPEDYGETIHKLSFKRALEYRPPILCDYKVITIHISKGEIEDLVRNRAFVRPKGWRKELEAEGLAALIALRKAVKKYPIRHAVSFHSSIRRSKAFMDYNKAFEKSFPNESGVEAFHVSGETPTGTRARIISDFSNSPRSLITNVRCLTEGVDVPNIDAVLFADPKNSLVDIVQATGRALRPSQKKAFGFVILPVVHKPGLTLEQISDTTSFKSVLTTLRALASQDERVIEYFRSISRSGSKRSRTGFKFDTNGITPKNVNLKHFSDSICLKIWERLAKIAWRPFNEARRFARNLGLASSTEWYEYCKGHIPEKGGKPYDIPTAPNDIYRTKGWSGFGDWLGTGTVQTQMREYFPFKKAHKIILSKNLKNFTDWARFTKSAGFPRKVPKTPAKVYKNKGWVNLGHWIGTGNLATRNRNYKTFAKAKAFVLKLNLRSQAEWKRYCKGELSDKGRIPWDIPKTPWATYKNKGWNGLSDWLGTRARGKRVFRSFKKARAWARSLNFSKMKDWHELCKGIGGSFLPSDIPTNPNYTYKNKGWIGYGDWLGTGYISNTKKEFLPFQKARRMVRNLGLKSVKEYIRFWNKTQKNPKTQKLPYSPQLTYKGKGWKSYPDWLGLKTHKKVSFSVAQKIMHRMKVKTFDEWKRITIQIANGYKDVDQRIPRRPNVFYKKRGWNGWVDWFGPLFVAGPRSKVLLKYNIARIRVRKLKIKNRTEYNNFWKNLPGTHPLKRGLPKIPQQAYMKNGWKGWPDFLGDSFFSKGKRQFLGYEDAKKVVKKLKVPTSVAWKKEVKKKNFPLNVPRQPKVAYIKSGWKGWGDFLGRS